MSRRGVIVKFVIEGVHCYPESLLPHLKNIHRHLFNFEIEFPVEHNERQIEIIEAGRAISLDLSHEYYGMDFKFCNFGNKSCETLAEITAGIATRLIGITPTYVKVLEDNENGAIFYP